MASAKANARKQARRAQHAGATRTSTPPSTSPSPSTSASGSGGGSRRLLLGAGAAIALVGIVVAAVLVLGGGGSDGTAGPSKEDTANHKDESGSQAFAWQYLAAPRQAQLDAELARARAAAMKYPTVADALAGGFELAQVADGTGAHLVNWKLMGRPFDIDEPPMLLYANDAPTAPVVALSYHVVTDSKVPPAGFLSTNDHWHSHRNMCWTKDRKIIGIDQSDADCKQEGGQRLHADGWMLHVWVLPGWDNPAGVFAPLNPKLADVGGTGNL